MAEPAQVQGEGQAVTADIQATLPGGPCNYHDLSRTAPTCGCRRFWWNRLTGGTSVPKRGAWCFCGHHACFHYESNQSQDQHQQQQLQLQLQLQQQAHIQALAVARTNELARSRNNQRAHTAGPRVEASKPVAGLGIDQGSDAQVVSQSRISKAFNGINDFGRAQEDGEVPDSGSTIPSTNAPTLVEEPRFSPNRYVEERLQQYQRTEPARDHSPETDVQRAVGSPTEENTPSQSNTPDLPPIASPLAVGAMSPGHLRPTRFRVREMPTEPVLPPQRPLQPFSAMLPQVSPVAQPPTSVREIYNLIQAHGQRLEALEGFSFSHVPLEEVHDRFERMDGRILDLEAWRTEHERGHASPEPEDVPRNKRRRLLPNEINSFDSNGSGNSNTSMHVMAAHAETVSRIDALNSRVAHLESTSLPSRAHPWQVEVVLLPWGRGLGRVWYSPIESNEDAIKSAQQTQTSDEWTGAQPIPKLIFKSADSSAWTTESIQAWADEAKEWLSPRASGSDSDVFQRLASRGFVRQIELTASDARHIMSLIHDAFGQVCPSQPIIETEDVNRYHGLQEAFIPLRKVKNSTRLRFLSPAEMVTSANWTAAFLDSSVFMKPQGCRRRLYITTPDAYVQPNEAGWSWKKIRRLPIYEAGEDEKAVPAQAATIEDCWAFNEKLDRMGSAVVSVKPQNPEKGSRSALKSNNARESGQRLPSPRSEAQSGHIRTTSLPSSGSGGDRVKDTLSKRRVASFEPPGSDEPAGIKRRRILSSSEAEKRSVNFTPGRSREPPSPFTSEVAVDARSLGTTGRKATSAAYATPFSHNRISRMGMLNREGGDTEPNTSIAGDQSDRSEKEWPGLESNAGGDANGSDRERVIEEFENDLEEE